MMRDQLTLQFPARASYARSDFIVSDCNREALAFVENWRRWPAGALALVGPSGAGKSHLAMIWRDMAVGESLSGIALEGEAWRDVDPAGAVIVDDAEEAEERALFHLMNAVRSAGGRLLLTAARPPQAWGVTLPDLETRLKALSVAYIDSPDDQLLQALLRKLLKDRRILAREAVLEYAVKRMERSFAAARELADEIERAADRREKVTTSLVSRIANRLANRRRTETAELGV